MAFEKYKMLHNENDKKNNLPAYDHCPGVW